MNIDAQTPTGDTIVCRNCSTQNTTGYRFCMKCGTQLADTAEQPQRSALAVPTARQPVAAPNATSRPGLAKLGMVLVAIMVVLCVGSRLFRAGSTTTHSSAGQTTLYQSLLGQSMDSPSTISFLHGSCKADISYVCAHLGMEIVDQDGKITGVKLHNQGGGFAAYDGELPNNLSWSDTRATVEQKLGLPEETFGGSEYLEYTAFYHRLGLLITYNASSKEDFTATMQSILVKQPQ